MMTGGEYHSSLPAPPTCPDPGGPMPPSPALPLESSYTDVSHTGRSHVGPPLCTGCSQSILDQFVLQVQGRLWHSRCLRCCICQIQLSHVCYSANTQMYCHDDFFRLFGASCSSCSREISPTEMVRVAHDNVYHVDCFRCISCRRELCTGDEFYLCMDGKLCCKTDYLSAKVKEEGQGETASTNDPVPQSKEEKERALVQYYKQNTMPKRVEVESIAREVGLDITNVRSWFMQQRARDKHKGDDRDNAEVTSELTNRVIPPPGGYPLPIVNKARSPGRLPQSASHPVNQHVTPTQIPSQPMNGQWTAWDELWSSDFVPPNVDLQPDHINKNGEVVRIGPQPSVPELPQPHHLPPLQNHPSHQFTPHEYMGGGNGHVSVVSW